MVCAFVRIAVLRALLPFPRIYAIHALGQYDPNISSSCRDGVLRVACTLRMSLNVDFHFFWFFFAASSVRLWNPGVQDLRNGIKQFTSWPTIPQVFIDGEFVGGCDIMKQMHTTGELNKVLGTKP